MKPKAMFINQISGTFIEFTMSYNEKDKLERD